MALCDYMLAKNMDGKFLLRIEDTDQKREVDGAAELIIETLKNFGLSIDNADDIPFQSKRIKIYQEYAQKLIDQGKAYRADGAVRFKAPPKTLISWKDLVKGDMTLPSLERDPVILKSDGFPPYNLACGVDDYLMGVTHVIRGEEWLPSTAEHIQLDDALGFTQRNFAHLPVICIIDGETGNKRKMSKRKDREANAQSFLDDGYPADAIIEYLLTIYNTDYELWRTANPNTSWRDFPFRFEKIGSNSPLFDWDKLNDISKNIIANMTCEQINAEVKKFFGDKLTDKQLQSVYAVLAVDRGTERPRKDIAKYSEILTEFDYLFKPVKMTPLLEKYAHLIKDADTKEAWLEKVKAHCTANNVKMRDYTQEIRVALTGREKTTDLYIISKLLLW